VMIVRPQGLFGIKELWDTQLWRRWFGGRGNTPRAIVRKPDKADKADKADKEKS